MSQIRHLAAIHPADVAWYSRLMGANEEEPYGGARGNVTSAAPPSNREWLIWVDGGPSCIVKKSAAVGGKATFARAKASGEDAPTPDY